MYVSFFTFFGGGAGSVSLHKVHQKNLPAYQSCSLCTDWCDLGLSQGAKLFLIFNIGSFLDFEPLRIALNM